MADALPASEVAPPVVGSAQQRDVPRATDTRAGCPRATVYVTLCADLKDGPIVVRVPP